MLKYNRMCWDEKYHVLQIHDCPGSVILLAAELGSNNITLENYHHNPSRSTITLSIDCAGKITVPKIKNANLDLQITQSEFKNLQPVWDENGCYAVFHDIDPLKFRATELDGLARYQALDNFHWTLELDIPGPTSNGVGQIASPSKQIIDQIEDALKDHSK